MTENSDSYEELEYRVSKFLGYERLFGFLTNLLAWALITLVGTLLILALLHYNETWQTLSSLVLGNAIWFLSTYFVFKKFRTYLVQHNEWATFYCHCILQSLAKRAKAATVQLKREYQKETLKSGEEFLQRINKTWNIGNFKLVQDVYGYPLNELKRNLEYRIIPRLKFGSEEELGKVKNIMSNFLLVSHNLKLEDIVSINRLMSELPTTEPKAIGLRMTLKNYLSSHRVVKDAMVVSSLVVLCSTFFYVVASYIGISRDYAFAGAVAIFACFVTIYYRRRGN